MNFFRNLTKTGRIIFAVFVGLVLFGVSFALDRMNIIHLPGHERIAFIPSLDKMSTKGKVEMAAGDASELALPSGTPTASGTELRKEGYEWQAQIAEMYATGGPVSTKGSLMEKNGVRLVWHREDDTGKSKEKFVTFAAAYAKELKDGNPKASPSDGIQLFTIMGSGAPAVMESLVDALGKYKLHAEIIGYSTGSSEGEDKLIGPREWKENPQQAKGGVVVCVPRDGDQDVSFIFAKKNQLKINTDTTYYDPEALNYYEVDDFKKAGELFVSGTLKIERPWKINGKVTSKKDPVQVRAVASWFPVDLMVFSKVPGMTTLESTKENPWQMPNITVGIKEWDENHRDVIEGFIAACAEAADQIKKYPNALKYAAKVETLIYNNPEMTADLYEKAFKGYKPQAVRDPFGKVMDVDPNVIIGGSSVKNLADNLYMFGLMKENTDNLYANTYNTFGEIQHKAYPKDLPKYPDIGEILNLSYVKDVAAKFASKATYASVEAPKYESQSLKTETLAKGDYTIEFRSGSSDFGGNAMPILKDIKSQVLMTNSYIEVHGYTDDVGSAEFNDKLSWDRANAIKYWLERNTGGTISGNRVRVFGHGVSNAYDNRTAAGKAKNRRIEIKFVKIAG